IALEIPDDLEIIPPEDQEYLAETKELVINEISAWEEGEAILSARFSAIGGEVSQTVKVVSLLSDGQESFVQTEEVKTINVLTPRLQTSSQINNTAYAIANFEDNIRFSAIVKNIGDVPLRDIAVTGNLSGEEVYWDQTTNSNLIALEPGQQTILTVDRRVAANVRPQNYSMSWQTQATAQIDDLDVTTYSQSSSSQVVFNSDLTFEADAEYYGNDGEQIGYGPYPLKAGETTAIRVFWKVSNFSNNLSNVTIQSQLPSQVEWTNFTSVSEGSAITYDPSTRKVTWHVSNLEANTHPQGANFELRITPNFQQVGQYINITHDSTLSALDSYTRQVLYRFQGPARLEKPVIE
ncbi:MAG: hypothetical protein U9N86_18080, partial [Bacteroidota bacterium]|nr:hypothetical protein [Bacteroidota bacterium]